MLFLQRAKRPLSQNRRKECMVVCEDLFSAYNPSNRWEVCMACVWLRSTPVYYIEMETTITCGAYSYKVGLTAILPATGLHARFGKNILPWLHGPRRRRTRKGGESTLGSCAKRRCSERQQALYNDFCRSRRRVSLRLRAA
jgi:hypothetical protein